MTTTFADHLLGPDTHADRPDAATVPAGTLYSCSDHDLVYQSDGATWATWATVGGPDGAGAAEILASHSYSPGSQTSVTTSSTSFADVDGTNVAITFTAPASGSVLIEVSGVVRINSGEGAIDWNLRSGSSDVAGTGGRMFYSAAGTDSPSPYVTMRRKVTGLTPGASYTYKLGHRASSGTVETRYGGTAAGTAGPIVLTATALPS